MITMPKINLITSVEVTTAVWTSSNKNRTTSKIANNKSMIAIMLTWPKIISVWKSQFQYRIVIKICSLLTNLNNNHIYPKRIVQVIEDKIRAWRCQLLHNVSKTIIENILNLLIEFHTNIKIDLQYRVYQSI